MIQGPDKIKTGVKTTQRKRQRQDLGREGGEGMQTRFLTPVRSAILSALIDIAYFSGTGPSSNGDATNKQIKIQINIQTTPDPDQTHLGKDGGSAGAHRDVHTFYIEIRKNLLR
jgi:hypothetical protein